jgi:ribosome-associated translation inhibitor RaiA
MNGTTEILDYIKSWGGSPYVSGDSWNPDDFNITKIFDLEPKHAVRLFLNQIVEKCENPQNSSMEILCVKSYGREILSNDQFNDIIDMLKQIERNLRKYDHRSKEREKAAKLVQSFTELRVMLSSRF